MENTDLLIEIEKLFRKLINKIKNPISNNSLVFFWTHYRNGFWTASLVGFPDI